MILSVGTGCAGSILRRGQEKGEARSGTTGKRFDEPAAAKDPGPLGCALTGARGVAPLGRCATSPFTARLADRLPKGATQPIRTDKIML
jgi:hypothetical protein